MTGAFLQLQWTWADAAIAPIATEKPHLTTAQLYKRWKAHERLATQFYELYREAVGKDKAKLAVFSESASEPTRRKPRVTRKQAAKRAASKSHKKGRK